MSIEPPAATTPKLADFPPLQYLSTLSALALSPSEAHGIYCGLLCSGARDAQSRWLDEILPKTATTEDDTDQCRAALTQLAEQTRAAVEGPPLGFSPLLPDAEADLAERAEAVHDWSRGFLYGLGLNGCDPNRFTGSTREALNDLSEITHLDLHDLDASEENEQSLTEIIEFLWVAAMLLYEDCGQSQTG
ncbi:UPF0149 family protein [Rhabdochromatium marinum]|uniref:UPF0149 family protein n=1 Tax=Rhabdochromatium marinum TaxID=48729 RepID=UPI00190801F2|nr:UPF0149 family protein [Rhabdochromatium marinum]MBK1648642.1 hypothetical protein [Rhabdochromatium marinum]